MVTQAERQLSLNIKLTFNQADLVSKIKLFIQAHLHDDQHAIFVVQGDAGTGKSVVLSQLFSQITNSSHDNTSDLYQTKNYFIVNHPELLKTYKQIARGQSGMLQKQFQRPTSFINAMHKKQQHNDITVIDEAHLLLSQPDRYNHFDQQNQLSEILKISQITVIVFDLNQTTRTKNYWDQAMLDKVCAPYTKGYYQLKQQFRIHASQALLNWLNAFSNGKLLPLPADFGGYDLRIYDSCDSMYQAILKRDAQYKLSRILATLSYRATLGKTSYVIEGDLKLPWDQYNYDKLPYPEIPETLHEVGSMFTCQGFDLNYAGVIIGPSIAFDSKTNRILPDVDKYTYPSAIAKRHDIDNVQQFNQIKRHLVMDDLNVLLKRGKYGLYLYVHNADLRNRLLEMYRKVKQ